MTIGFIWLLLPEPTMIKRKSLTPQELTTAIEQSVYPGVMSLKKTPMENLPLANLGKSFFKDKNFSMGGTVSCEHCHKTELYFTDGKKVAAGLGLTTRNTPTVINTFMNYWFFWDGRADSLESQALFPVESSVEHGFSRVQVAKVIEQNYKPLYESIFGPWPKDFSALKLTDKASPIGGKKRQMSTEIASNALQTLSNFDLLQKFLKDSQVKRTAPVTEFLNLVYAEDNFFDLKAWQKISDADKDHINTIFANFGKALAAYQKGLVALESPFDLFAEKYLQNSMIEPQKSFVTGFGEKEFAGLKLFYGEGQCALCHSGPNFTDQQFHNTGLSESKVVTHTADLGRAKGIIEAIDNEFNCKGPYLSTSEGDALESCMELPWLDTDQTENVGSFKTPTLRNIANTAPYFHDGRAETLSDVLSFYNFLQDKPAVGHRAETLQAMELTQVELEQLESFLRSLTSPIFDRSVQAYIK